MRSKRKKGRKERKLHSLRKIPTGTSICMRKLQMKFVVIAFSLFTLASYESDNDPILQTKAEVKETKQAASYDYDPILQTEAEVKETKQAV